MVNLTGPSHWDSRLFFFLKNSGDLISVWWKWVSPGQQVVSCAPCGKSDSLDEKIWPLLAFKSNWQLPQFNFKINVQGVTCFVPVQTTQKQTQRLGLAVEELWISLFNFPNQELSPVLWDSTSHSCSRKYSLSFGGYDLETNVCWVLLWISRVTESCSNYFFQDVLGNLQLPHFSLPLWKGCHYFQWPSHKDREEG